jgi:iron complex outermembrane recepter protein
MGLLRVDHDHLSIAGLRRALAAALLLALSLHTQTLAQDKSLDLSGATQQADLSTKSLEDLMSIEVSSVSTRQEKLSRTAAAVFVITEKDIEQSDAINIPDLLRMVPGLDVAQINGNVWAISSRGLNDRFSNELLVLVDGRAVYTPTFGGVFWDSLDLPLEDIDRIEVIRGPGGSIWGGNAVNGVINIITKDAATTRGALVEGGTGNVNQGFGTLQYGGVWKHSINYRAYAKYFNEDHRVGIGEPGDDGWHQLRGGFRADSSVSRKDGLAFQGDIYAGREGQEIPYLPSIVSPAPELIDAEVNVSGGFLQGVWTHKYSDRADFSLQSSFERYEHDDALREGRATFDLTFQDHLAIGTRQDVVWGAGYTYSSSHAAGSLFISLRPANLATHVFSAFAQDQIALAPNRLYVTLGTKIEHDYFSGYSLMPAASAAWMITRNRTLWASVARAERTPSYLDANIRLNVGGFIGADGTPVLISVFGNPHLADEGMNAYEAGYRASLRKSFALDVAAYYDTYDHQETTEPAALFTENSPWPPHTVIPSVYENLMHGESHGAEAFATWSPSGRFTLAPGYAYEVVRMHLDPSSKDTDSVAEAEGSAPVHSAQLRAHYALPHRLDWNTSAYFVDRLVDPAVPSYTRVDTSVSWHWSEDNSFTLAGQNLVSDRHLEYIDTNGSTQATLVKRGVYAKFEWRF